MLGEQRAWILPRDFRVSRRLGCTVAARPPLLWLPTVLQHPRERWLSWAGRGAVVPWGRRRGGLLCWLLEHCGQGHAPWQPLPGQASMCQQYGGEASYLLGPGLACVFCQNSVILSDRFLG